MTGWFQRNRSLLVIGLGTGVAVLVAVLLSGGPKTGADHDPDNPGARGSRAFAQVLEQEGVEVEIVRSADALEATTLDPQTTVLVTSPVFLGASTAQRLLAAAEDTTVVVAGAPPGTVKALGVDAGVAPTRVPGPRPANCTDTGLGDFSGMEIEVDEGAAYATSAGCFEADGGWFIASADKDLVLLGAPGILENDQVLRADNAAVALRLLGKHPRVVWYVPSLDDLVGDDGVSLRTLLPAWLLPATWLVGLTMLSVIWWRGRRLGALAVEPLPVSVRSLETTEARGRLYRSASARAHAAEVLRQSTRETIAAHLGLPVSDTRSLVRDVRARLGDSVADVDALIGAEAAPPRSDEELIRLASQLAELDTEVGRT